MKTQNKKRILGTFILLGVIAVSLAVFFFIGKPLIKFISEPEKFREFIDSFGIFGRLIFILMIVFQVVIAIIPGEPFEIVAGYAFNSIEGIILCILGMIIGSALIFIIVKRFGFTIIECFFSKEKIDSLSFLHKTKKISTLIFILMVIPGTPKDLISYFVGLTDIKLKDWLVIVAISRIPSVAGSVIGGDALGEQNYLSAIIVFSVTITISVIGILIYNHIQNKESKKK